MVKKSNKNINLSLISIVAIVAIVGLFVVMGSNSQQFSQNIIEEENLIGQAFKMPSRTIQDIDPIKGIDYSKNQINTNSEIKGVITELVYIDTDPLKDKILEESCNSLLSSKNAKDIEYHLEVIDNRILNYNPDTRSLIESFAVISVFDHKNTIYTTYMPGAISLTNSILSVMKTATNEISALDSSFDDSDSNGVSLVKTVTGFIEKSGWSIVIKVLDFVAPGFGTVINLIKSLLENEVDLGDIFYDIVSSVWGNVLDSIGIISEIFDIMNSFGFDIFGFLGLENFLEDYDSGYDSNSESSSGYESGYDSNSGSSSDYESGYDYSEEGSSSSSSEGGSSSSSSEGGSNYGSDYDDDDYLSASYSESNDGQYVYMEIDYSDDKPTDSDGDGVPDEDDDFPNDESQSITHDSETRAGPLMIINQLLDSLRGLEIEHNLEFSKNEIMLLCTNYYTY